ncbi:MAG: methylenetetrahydrofolate reductase C-terminal domain-containing protein [Candidatus Omnitrophica bacterium]|nr:methylenetetrahydrofolate reductase C-terminal domain-containing protein [Candidatus Omnitrophota bacterium]
MILTENKPLDEVLKSLDKDKKIFLLACNGCVESAQTGGEAALLELKKKLEQAEKTVVGSAVIDFLCNKVLVSMRLLRHQDKIKQADSVLIISCGIGVQAASAVLEKAVLPALNTISMGGFQGLWPSDERCEQCGDCVLDVTGGICPVTFCSKSLLNGPCGGTKEGKCEVDQERDCGWHLIYERLKKLGKLENLKAFRAPRNFNKMLPASKIRKTPFYDIEK